MEVKVKDMKGICSFSVVLGFTLLTFSSAHAQFLKGHQLAERWKEASRAAQTEPEDIIKSMNDRQRALVQLMSYTVYIMGVYDATCKSNLFVPPENATPGMIVRIVSEYLEAHPGRWNVEAASLVIKALTEAFPRK
jgi:hypothetical protein